MNETRENAEPDVDTPRRGVRRRDLLLGGAGLAVGVGATLAAPRVGGWFSGLGDDDADAETSTAAQDTTRRYVSSQVTAPAFDVWKKSGATLADGLLFAGVAGTVHQGIILDDDGEPVWIEPDGLDIMDLRVQTYRGEPVLTYWSGEIFQGNGRGAGTILDTSYRRVATVRATGGQTADLHEFLLTDDGTALLTTYPTERADLTSVDGPTDGWIMGCRIQEIDVATGATLLDWRAADHVAVDETYKSLGSAGTSAATPFDAFHFNSAEVDYDGSRLLLSARHTHALYSIDRSTGEVKWRLGGRKSDFSVDDGAGFAWQHDARRVDDDVITLFDNATVGKTAPSRGMRLKVDDDAMTVELDQEYVYKDTNAYAMGNTQTLAGGHVVVGWGMGHRVTEHDADGTALMEIDFGKPSYRVFRHEWSSSPAEKPAAAAIAGDDGSMTVYATWNGATEVARWRFDTGSSSARLSTAATVAKDGFETSTTVDQATWVRAVALASDGSVLGSSAVERV